MEDGQGFRRGIKKNVLANFFRNRGARAPVERENRRANLAKPPPSTPHSDINGIHQDERRNTDVAEEVGQDAADLKRAGEENVARPKTNREKSRDDRSR